MATPLHDEEFEARLLRRLAEEDGEIADDAALEADDDAADLLAMQQALGSYRRESLHWAEARSAAMPSPLPEHERGRRAGWLQAPQWALGTAAFCLCVMGAAVYTHQQASLAEQMAAAALPAAPTQQALAADNQLLSSVDDALRGSMAPSEQELGLTDNLLGESAQTRRHAQQRTN